MTGASRRVPLQKESAEQVFVPNGVLITEERRVGPAEH